MVCPRHQTRLARLARLAKKNFSFLGRLATKGAKIIERRPQSIQRLRGGRQGNGDNGCRLGDESRVSQAIRRIKQARGDELAQLRERLENAGKTNNNIVK